MTGLIFENFKRPSTEVVRWSDLDMSMDINPNTRSFIIKKNQKSLEQHIRLLFIDDGILFKPETNSGIDLELFENWSYHSSHIVKEKIRNHLRVYESRIEVLDISVEFDPSSRSLVIKVQYRTVEESNPITFSFTISSVY